MRLSFDGDKRQMWPSPSSTRPRGPYCRCGRLCILRVMAEKKSVSEAIEQAAREVEGEVKRAVDYIETNIVPRARRDGEKVLRRLSEELSRWADRLHDEEHRK